MSAHKRQVTVLGSTGSIGKNTLDVIARHPERFSVFALTASTNVDGVFEQIRKYRPQFAVMASDFHGRQLQERCEAHGLSTAVRWGGDAIIDVAQHEAVDVVMAAIVGAAGLAPTLAAARAGKRLLLANKEALVVGGQFFMDAVHAGQCLLLPIDSEHSAIFQALPSDPSRWATDVDKIILTASGGPFRTRSPKNLATVTPQEACAHPNWVMGRKISVDSATMMNKALEVIEAKYLFGLHPEQIQVVIHPQSVIHSMVQFVDRSVVAQLGTPDMRGPIAYGLSWPQRMESGASGLDFSTMSALTFESIEREDHQQRFSGLSLAWAALRAAPGSTAILNAANEVAVDAFLNGALRFDRIASVNESVMSVVTPHRVDTLGDLLELDRIARAQAAQCIQRYS